MQLTAACVSVLTLTDRPQLLPFEEELIKLLESTTWIEFKKVHKERTNFIEQSNNFFAEFKPVQSLTDLCALISCQIVFVCG